MEPGSSMSAKEKIGIPFALDKFEDQTGLNIVESAQLLTLSLLDWMEKQKIENPSSDLKASFMNWLKYYDPDEKISTPVKAYEQCLQAASNIIPYIKSDVQKLLKQSGTTGYSDGLKIAENAQSPLLEADSFVDDEIEEVTTYKCQDCNSTECEDVDLIVDQSTSVDALSNLFTFLCQKHISEKSKVLILFSGIGSLVYGTVLFTKVSSILSCVPQPQLSCLQNQIIQKFGMSQRVSIINSVLPEDLKSIGDFDLVIISKRFSTFQEVIPVLYNLQGYMKTGAFFITFKELKYMFESEKLPTDLENWVHLEYELGGGAEGGLEYYCIYKVL